MSNSSNSTPNTIAIIDASVPEYESLVAGLAPGVEVVVLNPTQDGIAQISNALLGRSDVDSIQIFSHGASQSLQLGSTQLSLENLETYTAQLQQWSSALSANADILLYGCNVASTGTGLIDRLSQFTGADVAASTNLTGAGGDWNLEVATGKIESTAALSQDAIAHYSNSLATYTVTSTADSGAGSLRAIVAAAAPGSTIRFAAGLANKTIGLTSGQINIPAGKNLIIDGAGVANLTISGGNKSRIFNLQSTSVQPTSLTVKNLALSNGFTTERGGAIATEHQGTLTVENVRFNNNVANLGGGAISTAFEGTLTVTGSKFTNNKATAGNDERGAGAIAFRGPRACTVRNSEFVGNQGINGGAINSLNGKLTIENSKFINNNTLSASYDAGKLNPTLRGYGGAVYTDRASSTSEASGFIRIVNSIFEGNKGKGEGGAAYLYTGKQDNVTLKGSLFRNNEVQALSGGNKGNGGAVVLMSNELNQGFTINNSAFVGNTASGQGGGLWMMKAPTNITNSTFSGNRVLGTSYSNVGGGMSLYGPTNLVNTTIAFNTAGWVGGGVAASNDYTVTAKNSIFYNNDALNGGNNWRIRLQTSRELSDGGGNLQFTSYLSTSNNRSNDNLAVKNIRIADPRLAPLQVNGNGFLPTHALLAGSAAINAGVAAGAPLVDQRGVKRDTQVDVGAFEFNGGTVGTVNPQTMQGTAGNDMLMGTGVKDTMLAGGGNDMLIGMVSSDVMTGGLGQDRFVYFGGTLKAAFASSRVAAPDRITDLKFAQGDRIMLDFDNNILTGDRPTGFFHAGVVAGTTLAAAAKAAFTDKDQQLRGLQSLDVKEAVLFKWNKRTYIGMNDNTKSFGAAADMVVDVTGIGLATGDATAGVLSVTNYFS